MKLRPWTLPQNYAGATWYGYLIAPVTRQRDSDILEESNWAHQLKILAKVDEAHEESGEYSEHQNWQLVSENHWAVGWVEWIAVHPEAKPWVAALERLADRLDQYPIADEHDYSERECESANQAWANFSVADRVKVLQRCGWTGSVLVARRSYVPRDDNGRISDYLLAH